MASRIQLRRGNETDWVSADPILFAGEVAISLDLNKIKIGDGTSHWSDLNYINLTTSDINIAIDGAISTHNSDTTSVHGISDTSELETKTGAQSKADDAQTAAEDYADSLASNYDPAGSASTAQSNAETFSTNAINALDSDDIEEGTTNKYFTDERALNATSAAYDAAGSASTAQNNAELYADSLASNYDEVGSAATAQTAAQLYADSAVSTHSLDTTSVHGISNTENLVYTDDSRLSDQRTPSDNSVTSAKIVNGTIVNEDISSSAAIDQSKISGLSTDLSNKQPLDADLTSIAGLSGTSGYLHKTAADTWALDTNTFINTSSTSQTKDGDMTIVGTLTATDVVLTGTGTTIETTNLSVTDSLIYLADQQYTSDSLDIGIYGAYGTIGDSESSHPHTGLVRDASDGGKWKLVSGAPEPVSNVVDFTGVTYDTLKVGAIEVSSTSVVTNFNADQLDGHDASYFATASDYLTTATAASTYQPLDGDLTAISTISGTSGLLKKTAEDTWELDTTAYSTTTGTVTSIGISVPTGLSVSNTPVTSFGTIGISLSSGYSIPTTSSQSNWDTAYTDRLKWDGGTTGLNAATARTSLGLGSIATESASSYATLASPTFTGVPIAPTATTDTNTTQIATTAFVIGQGYLKSATASSTYAPISSPTLTGTPLAPTATSGTNTTQIATTAYVQGELSGVQPTIHPMFIIGGV